MLYVDDAGIVSRSLNGVEKIMTVIVSACMCRFRSNGLGGQNGDNVSANERWGERAVHRHRSRPQTTEFVYLGGSISADWTSRSVEVTRRLQRAWTCFGRYKMEIYDRPSVRQHLNVRMLTAEVIETLLYGLLGARARLREIHHKMLLRCIG